MQTIENQEAASELPPYFLAKLAALREDFSRYEDGHQSYPWKVVFEAAHGMLESYKTTTTHQTGHKPDPMSEDYGDILIDELNALLAIWQNQSQLPEAGKAAFNRTRDGIIDVLNAYTQLESASPAQQSLTDTNSGIVGSQAAPKPLF